MNINTELSWTIYYFAPSSSQADRSTADAAIITTTPTEALAAAVAEAATTATSGVVCSLHVDEGEQDHNKLKRKLEIELIQLDVELKKQDLILKKEEIEYYRKKNCVLQ